MPLPPLLKEVEAKYARAATVTANFSEIDESGALKQKKKSSGGLEFKKPGKIRWENQSPDKNRLSAMAKTYWFYTPPFDPEEAGQYWVKEASQVQSKFAQTLLAGKFSGEGSVKPLAVKQISPTDFSIYPRKGTADPSSKRRFIWTPRKN